jgi:hypothetical protein
VVVAAYELSSASRLSNDPVHPVVMPARVAAAGAAAGLALWAPAREPKAATAATNHRGVRPMLCSTVKVQHEWSEYVEA